jgi:hypothetical protein
VKKLFILPVLFAFILVSCDRYDSNDLKTTSFSMNINSDELTQRLTYPNVPIHLTSQKSTQTSSFVLVGEADSPMLNGEKLSASSVIFGANNRVYVTYHHRGEPFGGAIVAFNVVNPSQPVITSQIIFNDIDINIVSFKNQNDNKIYLGGASATNGAVVIPVNLNGGTGDLNTNQNLQIAPVGGSPSVNGIVHVGNRLIVSAGYTSGGLWSINQGSMQIMAQTYFDGSKSVATNGLSGSSNRFMSLKGGSMDNAILYVYKGGNNPNFNTGWQFNLGVPAIHQNVEPNYEQWGKMYMFIKPNTTTCYVPLGMNGMKAINFSQGNGQLVYQSPAGMLTTGNCNAVGADNDYVYMANGSDGVCFATVPTTGTTLNIFGVWDNTQYPGSVNFIASNNTHIFVAKGKEGGLKILLKVN